VDDPRNPNRYLIRVQEVSTISEDTQKRIERVLCLTPNLPASECPEGKRATEVKFSPGGDKVTARFPETPDLAWVSERFGQVTTVHMRPGANNPVIQNARDHKVEIQLMSKGDQLVSGLRRSLGAKAPDQALRSEWIGPRAGAQLRDSAVKSILIAIVFIMAYIAFRFDLRFAPGAVVALAHDSAVTLGILILLDKEINLTTVAALLTIVGYSINDTVVVFDRVRENLGKLRGSGFLKIINISLSEMLNRTLLTSGTTIFSMLAFFLWGTGTLKDFALTLIVGIVLGTYSSIYIALPITHWLDKRFFQRFGGSAAGGANKNVVRPKKEVAVV
jgi:preprotein translocase subunit SecF